MLLHWIYLYWIAVPWKLTALKYLCTMLPSTTINKRQPVWLNTLASIYELFVFLWQHYSTPFHISTWYAKSLQWRFEFCVIAQLCLLNPIQHCPACLPLEMYIKKMWKAFMFFYTKESEWEMERASSFQYCLLYYQLLRSRFYKQFDFVLANFRKTLPKWGTISIVYICFRQHDIVCSVKNDSRWIFLM